MNDKPIEGIAVQGSLRGEFALGPRGETVWLLHDFIADDGTEFKIKSTVTSTAAFAVKKA